MIKLAKSDINEEDLFVILCYIPPVDTTFVCQNCEGDYFSELHLLVELYSQQGNIVVTGDLNARTGMLPDFIESINCECIEIDCSCERSTLKPRKSKDSVVKEYGRDLINMCKATGLFIANGRVHNDLDGEFTRDGSTGRSVVDYLLVNRKSSNAIVNFKVDTQLPDSNHKLLSFSISNVYRPKCNVAQEGSAPETRQYYKWDNTKVDILHEHMFDVVGAGYLQEF